MNNSVQDLIKILSCNTLNKVSRINFRYNYFLILIFDSFGTFSQFSCVVGCNLLSHAVKIDSNTPGSELKKIPNKPETVFLITVIFLVDFKISQRENSETNYF